MSVEPLSVAPDETTASRLEKEIREAIIRLELLPGARLSEQDLATRYGVSRQPVREALISLAKSNLVKIRPQRGTVVVRISVEQMLEARFVREAVESAVVRRACKHFDPWVRQRITSNLTQQQAAVKEGDHELCRRIDSRFHILIAKGAGCSLAWMAVADMKSHMDRVSNLTLMSADAREGLMKQHHEIIEAIDARDADRAERIMREHLQEILADLGEVEEKFPDLFE